ncbi:alpha/beta hydrolase [Flavobacterium pectinovorum]|uniref:Alpha/beta hydrolase n=1 Tax=Flavobacterium pectinovorum TaxID=29533 RepID=A0AB36NZL2_9FLAO|nr:alpha/beta hydrolase [Flavobacterium pectinovorum]OXB03741.1 alpha/beta hydrolase [Flavobacterium pectinovorum]SHL65619.1 Lysophospholipase, alpha-beta hydrolase superfamily [Flavobacterium pectinovorum]
MLTENPTTILFITGAFVSNKCWDDWKVFFESKGFTTLAPAWPYKDAPAAVLRDRHPDPQIAGLRLTALIDHFENITKNLPQKPIIIGHSIGGLIAQILLQRNLASAAIAIHSVPPQGIMTFKFSFLKAGWGPLGFFTSAKKTFLMTFSQWQYAFTNGMPEEWQEKAYYDSVIPESKLIVRDTITSAAKVDFNASHNPLLLIAGSADHTIPKSLNYSNYKKYTDKNSITDFKVFPERNHFVLNQPGWQEIAVFIQDWIGKLPA